MSFFFSAAIPQPERTRSICLHCYRRLSRPQNFRKDFGGQKGLISCNSASIRRYSKTTDSDSRQTHYEETAEKQPAELRNMKFNSNFIRRIINTLTSVGSSISTLPADFLSTKASLTSGLNRLNVATPIPHSTKFLSPQSKLTSRSLHKTNLKEHYVYYISQGDYGRTLEILKKLRAESDSVGTQRRELWNQKIDRTETKKSGSKKGTNKGKKDEWKEFEVQMVIERLGRENSIERMMSTEIMSSLSSSIVPSVNHSVNFMSELSDILRASHPSPQQMSSRQLNLLMHMYFYLHDNLSVMKVYTVLKSRHIPLALSSINSYIPIVYSVVITDQKDIVPGLFRSLENIYHKTSPSFKFVTKTQINKVYEFYLYAVALKHKDFGITKETFEKLKKLSLFQTSLNHFHVLFFSLSNSLAQSQRFKSLDKSSPSSSSISPANEILSSIKSSSFPLTTTSLNLLLSIYFHNRTPLPLVLDLYNEMVDSNDIEPDMDTYKLLLSIYMRHGENKKIEELFKYIKESKQKGIMSDQWIYERLIEWYSGVNVVGSSENGLKAGYRVTRDLVKAENIFKEVIFTGPPVKPSIQMYNALLRGYVDERQWSDAFRVVEEMVEAGVEWDLGTVDVLLRGLRFDDEGSKIRENAQMGLLNNDVRKESDEEELVKLAVLGRDRIASSFQHEYPNQVSLNQARIPSLPQPQFRSSHQLLISPQTLTSIIDTCTHKSYLRLGLSLMSWLQNTDYPVTLENYTAYMKLLSKHGMTEEGINVLKAVKDRFNIPNEEPRNEEQNQSGFFSFNTNDNDFTSTYGNMVKSRFQLSALENATKSGKLVVEKQVGVDLDEFKKLLETMVEPIAKRGQWSTLVKIEKLVEGWTIPIVNDSKRSSNEGKTDFVSVPTIWEEVADRLAALKTR